MLHLELLINNTWSGDVAIEEVRALRGIDFEAANTFLADNPEYVKGIPFPHDDPWFDHFAQARNPGVVAILAIIATFDDPININEYDK